MSCDSVYCLMWSSLEQSLIDDAVDIYHNLEKSQLIFLKIIFALL